MARDNQYIEMRTESLSAINHDRPEEARTLALLCIAEAIWQVDNRDIATALDGIANSVEQR